MPNDEQRVRLIEAAAALLAAADGHRLNIISLNKALFYLDLVSLRDFGETFTQNTYIALPMGPVVAGYRKKLIRALRDEGVATQKREGEALPVYLEKLPKFSKITPSVRQIARLIGANCSKTTSANLSNWSHENLGWIIAREEEEKDQKARARAGEASPKGRPQPINMLIAMQQVVDNDPWLDEPMSESLRGACDAADRGEGVPW